MLTAIALLSGEIAGCENAHSASVSAADSVRADSVARARQDSINRAQPGYVVDSIHPVEEELARFRAAVGGAAVAGLQHASPSRDALVARIVDDVARGDSADLARAAITPARVHRSAVPELALHPSALPPGTGTRLDDDCEP